MKNLAMLKVAGLPGGIGPTVISTLELRPDLLSFSGTKLSDCPRRFVRVALKRPDQDHVQMVFALNRPVLPQLVAKLIVHVS